MSRVKFIAGVVVIFLLGGAAGWLGARHHLLSELRPPRRHAPLAQRVDFIMARLDDDLDLTEAQKARIRPIVTQGEREIREIKRTVSPQIRAVFKHNFAAIRQELDPARQEALDRLVERIKKFHRAAKEGEARPAQD